MKKLVIFLLSCTFLLSVFAGCGNKKQIETPKVEDDGIMKILVIGHSTSLDSAYQLPAIAKNEGVEKLVVGMLYHSGCRLAQHVEFLKQDAAQYAYYEFDIETQDAWLRADCNGNFAFCEPDAANDVYINDGSIAQTMLFGIRRHDWDIVVMVGGIYENSNLSEGDYTPNLLADIQAIRNYVEANDTEPATKPKYSWNADWGRPTDETLWRDNDREAMMLLFNGDPMLQRQTLVDTMKDIIKPAENFDILLPSTSVLWNAEKLGVTPRELHRDFIHASDFTRAMVGYLWYCVLFEKNIDECNFAPISSKLLFDPFMRNTGVNLELNEEQKTILITSVKNAIANPYDICQ